MIIKTLHSHSPNGTARYRLASDLGVKIRQIETETLYNSVIDTEHSGYSYEETQEKTDMEIKRYSTLKIIRALGDQWNFYKEQLAAAGILDQFYAANYLRSDDPVLLAFLETIPRDLRIKLDECLWEY